MVYTDRASKEKPQKLRSHESEAQKEKCIPSRARLMIKGGSIESMVGCRTAVFTFCTLTTTKNI